jgi:hypothetical protein
MGYSYVLNTIAYIYNEKQELSKALALYEELYISSSITFLNHIKCLPRLNSLS